MKDKIKQLKDKYGNSKALYRLAKGEEIIGQEVDEKNQLWYVIKKGEDVEIKKAMDCDVLNRMQPRRLILDKKTKRIIPYNEDLTPPKTQV